MIDRDTALCLRRPMAGSPLEPDLAEAGLLARLGRTREDMGGRLRRNEPMLLHTSFRVGGPADLFLSPGDPEEIAAAAAYCRDTGLPLTVLGNGSNVVISDQGIRGLVLSIGPHMARLAFQAGDGPDTARLRAEAGAMLAAAAAAAARNGWSGLEFASGIPGSVGGAVYMNAGAYERCMEDVVVRTEYLDREGAFRQAEGPAHRFAYRHSLFMDEGGILLATVFRLSAGDPAAIAGAVSGFAARRRRSQPLEYPSAGSVFKRPPGLFAGKLIEECGLKGCRIGGAQVSVKHAGFIVNTGGATAADIAAMVDHVRETVLRRAGVVMECEIRFVGDWKEARP